MDLVPQLLERRTTIQAELEEREDHVGHSLATTGNVPLIVRQQEHAASVLSSHHAAPQEASIEDPTELARQQHSNYVPQAQVTFSGGSGQADIKKARKAAARQAKAQQLGTFSFGGLLRLSSPADNTCSLRAISTKNASTAGSHPTGPTRLCVR